MTIKKIFIQNFRNIVVEKMFPDPHINLIVGDNGSGKTAFLESLWFLSTGRSFKTANFKKVIHNQSDALLLYVKTLSDLGLKKHKDGALKIKIDGVTSKKISDLAYKLPIQLISPESFSLLLEGPKMKREYMDWGCFHYDVSFYTVWLKYHQLLKVRNTLLKKKTSQTYLHFWNEQLIYYGNKLTELRFLWFNDFITEFHTVVKFFLPVLSIQVSLFQGWDNHFDLTTAFKKQYQRDVILGYTTVGPHKADLRFKINNVPVQDFLSRGQLKLLVCVLKLVQGSLLEKGHIIGQKCIYLIDDLSSELDMKNRMLLLDKLKQNQNQVFMTAIDQSSFNFTHWNKLFHVKRGVFNEIS